MPATSVVLDLALAAFIALGVREFAQRYRRLEEELARGDTEARSRLYRWALVFEWTSAALALGTLRFDWSALRPDALALGQSALVRRITLPGDAGPGLLPGIVLGLVLGTLGLVVVRMRANRQGARAAAATPRWLNLLPDFAPMLPVTGRERLLWLAVSISAGVCEEIVFRGWLLTVLHHPVGLTGTWLILAAAVGFGLAHAYQGASGVVLASVGGALFCALYVATGSLLVPILLHTLVDARFALLPSPARSAAG